MTYAEIATATAAEILAEAVKRGYTTYAAPTGQTRIGGSKAQYNADEWISAANSRLFEIEKGKSQ